MHDLAVFIGRFQPFHIGHKTILNKALIAADRVLVLIGSSFEPRSLRNPFFFEEREALLRACFSPQDNKRIICRPLRDIRYNDALWLRQVQKAIYEIEGDKELDITLIGLASPQGTGYFTSLFPQWNATPIHHNDADIHGVDIRHHLFSGGKIDELHTVIAPETLEFIKKFMMSDAGNTLQQEHHFIELYKKGWENAPFQPTHVTVDCVVIQSGHVLLVKRNAQPGKGLLALPGGFIHAGETVKNTKACILVGKNYKPGRLTDGPYYVKRICELLTEAESRGEKSYLKIEE